jgi:hypothetical protein
MVHVRQDSRLRVLTALVVLGLALGGVLHQILVPHTLADLDHSAGAKPCAVCQASQHNAGLASVPVLGAPVLLPQANAFIPPQSRPRVSAPSSSDSRAPPVLS